MEECGLRAVIGAAVIGQESGYTKNFADAMNKADSFIGQWKAGKTLVVRSATCEKIACACVRGACCSSYRTFATVPH